MILDRIQSPDDLKRLPKNKLSALAEELRKVIIEQVSSGGGHLASNLGVIELTIALHSVLDTPSDKIIWDVGHQSYPHKLLTGRYERFSTLRKYKGLSGFPRIDESPYDVFGAGHSSTSISAALGIIEARDKKGEDFNVVAVIGDGSMTSGLAFEGLNHAGQLKKNLIVVLNDNEMSISENVGALSAYLNRILTGEAYRRFKKETKTFLAHIPKFGTPVSKLAQRTEEMVKGFFLPGILFEELGFNYVGPIDGHDIAALTETLKRTIPCDSPTLIHVMTTKGKGYQFSEEDPCVFHGIGPFDKDTGLVRSNTNDPTYSELFGQEVTRLAGEDIRVITISAAMREGTGLDCFAKRYPERFYDVGIAEPHAVTFAAGLASQGLRPVVAIYSTFLQRAYDEIVHDVCLQNLPVVFAVDRGGIVGEDGPTHQGLFDLSFLRHIPNLLFMAPKDGEELKSMLRLALQHNGPSAIRYPRGKVVQIPVSRGCNGELRTGKAEVLSEGDDMAIVAIGNTVHPALKAAERLMKDGIRASVINARFITPLDEELVRSVAEKTKRIVTVEENVLAGGFGSAILECLSRAGLTDVQVWRIGVDNEFVEHGSQAILKRKYGLDEDGIYALCKTCFTSSSFLL
ncbi:MAG TPA: 1-deoxy-D-xylulose-5-phosphate synthase [Thermodesulfovibrionales bacterium]|jgi:1-deoxy-D-xylulose-5-phosphate synthase|nr:1-deoxy-D-xylulose-5-phosphate synthase [Thermodesulfovibrionales bacterium]